jgi:hypothetical protein
MALGYLTVRRYRADILLPSLFRQAFSYHCDLQAA